MNGRVHKISLGWMLWALGAVLCSHGAIAHDAPSPDVPAGWWADVQHDIAATEYHVTWQEETGLPEVDAAWHAPNRAQDLRTYFTPEGPRVVRRTETEPSWLWGLELIGMRNAE